MAAAVPFGRRSPRRAGANGGRRAAVSASLARSLLRLAVLTGAAVLVSLHLRAASLLRSSGPAAMTGSMMDLPGAR